MRSRPFTVSLLDFIRTGHFGHAQLGMTNKEVERSFAKPDDKNYMGHGACIWRYSYFEFTFYNGVLGSFWCDNLCHLKSPSKKQFKLDTSILNGRNDFWFFTRYKLQPLGISYTLWQTLYKGEKYPESIILKPHCNSTVTLHFQRFDEEADYNKYELVGIGSSHHYNDLPKGAIVAFTEPLPQL